MALTLTTQEVRDLRVVFDVFDASGSGSIDRNDLRKAIKVLGFRVSRQTLEERAREADQKSSLSGEVSFQSFLQVVEGLQDGAYDLHGELVQAFQHMAGDDGEALTVEALRTICSSVGLRLTDAELQGMMEVADRNGDGRVDCEEFIAVMLRTNLFR